MRGRDDAHVGADRLAAADGGELAFLQHPQQARLRVGWHVADLVEEQRAAGGLLEAALAAIGRPGEGAALVAEQLALDQLARDRRHVDRHERARAPPAVVVQGARDQFLAGAALAVDHHRQIRGRQPRDAAIDLLHRGTAADQRQLLVGVARRRRRGGRHRRRNRQRARDHRQQLLQVERLRQILERAALGRLHRCHQGRLRAHHHHAQLGAHAADARDQIQPVRVRHHHVGDDQVALAVLDPAPQGRGVRGAAHLVAGAAERLRQHGADRTVVIGDEDRRHGGHGDRCPARSRSQS